MRRSRFYVATLAVAFLLGSAGCFNDAFRGREINGVGSATRFELLIEPDRTLVEGTHFLVDRATGDLWRLDVRDRSAGTWVRLADGPLDAVKLNLGIEENEGEEEESDD